MIIKRIRNMMAVIIMMAIAWMTTAVPAWAVGGINTRTAEETAAALVTVLNTVVQPIGAFVIFIVVAWTAFLLITSAHRPEERAKAMGSIPYILGGGIGLGAVLIISGFVVGLMVQVAPVAP